MKTITLHLTFSAAVLEILCSLSQLGQKDHVRPQTYTTQREEGRRGRGGKGAGENACPITRMKGPATREVTGQASAAAGKATWALRHLRPGKQQ